MSAPGLEARASSSPSSPSPDSPGAAAPWWRRHRSSALIGLTLLLAVALVIAFGSDDSGQGGDVDPRNAGPDGAQAVAKVLDDQGVDVTIVRSADELDETEVDDSTTVVVTSTADLGGATIQRLQDHARGARIVYVDPAPALLDTLGFDATGLDTSEALAADCDAEAAGLASLVDGLELEVDDATALTGDGCYRGALVQRRDTILLGAGDLLTNDQVLRADNAAVALRLLGQDPRLVWYVPSYLDLSADDTVSIGTLLPDFLRPALLLLFLVMLSVVGWRVRRLGPLATEPLPVSVRAIETTRSRGRLYRKAGDRAHAAQALRSAARGRAAARLRLGAGYAEDALVRDVARHVSRPAEDVARLLSSAAPAPGTDKDLTHLAGELAALDREVRRS